MPTNISTTATWNERSAAKKKSVLNGVPAKFIHGSLEFRVDDITAVLDIPSKLLTEEELSITVLDATTVVAAIAKKNYSCVQVLDAFTHRAAIAHKLLNCCLEFRYGDARAEAERLDAHYRETGKLVGPLHGLPISVKDQCRIVGTETTCGFVDGIGRVDTEDSVLVDILKRAGAIIFVKTNLSIGCFWGETINNVIGHTSNPFNRSFSCGGSSGGEGALLGMHGSPMGVGSDLGGSIRSPSAYQGLWGLRPSTGRIPYYKMLNSMEGNEIVESVAGPMSHSPESLELFVRTVADSQPWLHDPKCHPLPWREHEFRTVTMGGRKLRIGLMSWDGYVLPQPPIRRAMNEVVEKLTAAGHEIVPWRVDQKKALSLLTRAFTCDGRGDHDRTIARSGEPDLNLFFRSSQRPDTLLENWALAMERNDFRAEVLEQWNATADENGAPIDVYLTPVNPSVCPKHGDYKRVRYLGYTGTANCLDFTACTIPVSFVDPEKDLADAEDGAHDAQGNKIPSPVSDLDRAIRNNYRPEIYGGLPLTVQIVGRRLEEEKVLGIAQTIRQLL
ncbi:Acetamidase [Knufia peltigerae]|uniref:amidase n=1 Tax=Knufia peltigerae TaxID=1002370 RepID=A0AA39D076_9EURO|nr:Acetamidase [Knufia peltigerae]